MAYNWRVNYFANSVQLVVGNPGDFNNDGIVDAAIMSSGANGRRSAQLPAWRSHFGRTTASGSSLRFAAVPEPASLCYLLLAAACGLAAQVAASIRARSVRSVDSLCSIVFDVNRGTTSPLLLIGTSTATVTASSRS